MVYLKLYLEVTPYKCFMYCQKLRDREARDECLEMDLVLLWTPWTTCLTPEEANQVGDSRFGGIIFPEESESCGARIAPVNHTTKPKKRIKVRVDEGKWHARHKNHSRESVTALKALYQRDSYPDARTKINVAHTLNMTVEQVSTWFSNHRKRTSRFH